MRKSIAERDAKIGALESAGERLRSEIGAAAKKHDESQSALDALRSKLEASQSAAEAQQKSINEERRSLTQLIDGLKLENAELVNRLAAMPPPAPPEYESAKREMTALRKDLAERETRLSTTESMLAQLRVELAAAERTRTESDESLRIIRHDLETARAAVLEQQQQADAAIRREEQLVAEMSVLRDASAKTAATAAGLAEELAASRIQAETNLAASEAARLDLATAREQLDQLRTESDQIARQRDTLAADIDLARQSLQARSEKEAILVRDLAGARDEAARLAKRENHLGDLLQAAERSRDEMASGLRESEAKAAEAAAHAISQAEIDAVRSQLDESRVECAKLNEKFTHLAAENQKLTSQLADADSTASKLRADLAALQDQSAIAAHALEEAESEIERLRTDWNRLLAERKELVGRVSRSNEEAERLISEKSALLMAFSEMEDRAKNLESERGVGQELRQRIAATTEENTFLREQLEAVSNVSADIENSRKKIAELEDDNRSLREQMRRMEHESLAKEASTGASLGEAKLRRRIEELETTLRTAESVTHTLKNRLRTQESDQQRRQNSDTVAGIEPSPEIASELGIRLRTSEQAARKLQAERDAAIRTQEELENTLQAVNEQARELHAKLDAATNAAGTSARQSAMGANAGGVGSGRPISTSSLIMIIASVAVFVAILWLCGILDLSMLGLPSAQHVSPPVHR
jgi:chromosome segregation ATPase